jgi:hypothetical protein
MKCIICKKSKIATFKLIISYFTNVVNGMSHNVPAVYDVFAVAIRERGVFQQPQKCGWRLAWE